MMYFFVEMEAAAGSRGPTSKSEISLLPHVHQMDCTSVEIKFF